MNWIVKYTDEGIGYLVIATNEESIIVKPMNILFKYPTRSRPEWFKETLKKYYSMLSGKNQCHFLITLDNDDETMNNKKMKTFMNDFSNLQYKYGNHKTKIEAINADMENIDFDVLFLISDDMIPMVPGFDFIIAKNMQKYFPDLDGALHFYEGRPSPVNCITLTIMGKKLYDYFGYIYHPDYKSLCCDHEYSDEVRRMKKVKEFSRVLVKHCWTGDHRNADDLYNHNNAHQDFDKSVYNKRKMMRFPRKISCLKK